MNKNRLLLLLSLSLSVLLVTAISGCSGKGGSDSAPLPDPPYILKEGCTFTIVHENGSLSVDSPKVSGLATGSGSVTDGVYTLEVANCEVVSCSHPLTIYER
jgi:hypothetical protein